MGTMYKLLSILMICSNIGCNSQSKTEIMKTKTNKNYMCDIQTGICSPTKEVQEIEQINYNSQQKVKLIYYTDPTCSACWAIAPELTKFELEYGDYIDIEYKMGGLVKTWDGFQDVANGIYKPADVAPHWDEIGEYSGMSIDGNIWIEDPLSSSYPSSIAFKAMQKQGSESALKYLRRIREMVFLEKKNISKESILLEGVKDCEGDTSQFLLDFHSKEVKQSFYDEIAEGKKMGVRGFPTFIFVNESGSGFKISGMSGYKNYVKALEQALGEKTRPKSITFNEISLLRKYKFLSTKEIYFILSQEKEITMTNLERLSEKDLIKKEDQKFGEFWRYIE